MRTLVSWSISVVMALVTNRNNKFCGVVHLYMMMFHMKKISHVM